MNPKAQGRPHIDAAKDEFVCPGCGSHEKIGTPMSLKEFGERCRAFADSHQFCCR